MNTIPSPAALANRRLATAPTTGERPRHERQTRIVADVDLAESGRTVRPGMATQIVEEVLDGVVKTKHLKRGMVVRPFVHGEARGSFRIVERVKRIEDGAYVEVEWSTSHATSTHKAAYRWYCEELDGTTVRHEVQVPAFVPVHEEE